MTTTNTMTMTATTTATVDFGMDNASRTVKSEMDFLDFLQERDERSTWYEEPVANITVIPVSEATISSSLSDNAKNEAKYTVDILNGEFYISVYSIPTLQERAKISGRALSELSESDPRIYSDIINRCLTTAKIKELSTVRVQDGKVVAFLSDTYVKLPQLDIYEAVGEKLQEYEFAGAVWTHTLTAADYAVDLPTETYKKILMERGYDFDDVISTLRVSTSDCGYSGVNIAPSIVGVSRSGKQLRVPMIGALSLDHKGEASIKKVKDNLSMAFAKYNESIEALEEMSKTQLNYPFNCLCNVLKAVGIGKKVAQNIIDRFAVTTGNVGTATAADIFLAACEIPYDNDRVSSVEGVLRIEESVARILKVKRWSDYDRPVNTWRFVGIY